jgi:hypothetical protein
MSGSSRYSVSDWGRDIDLSFHTMEHRVAFFSDPARWRGRDKGWLGSFVASLVNVRYLLQRGDQAEYATGQPALRLRGLVEKAQAGTDLHLLWLQQQLDGEAREAIEHYHAGHWVEGVRAGLPGELWYTLNQRDRIQAYLTAHELLHSELKIAPEWMRLVEEADQLLRDVGPQLWVVDGGTGWEGAEREWRYPRSHWWWWLDETDSANQ